MGCFNTRTVHLYCFYYNQQMHNYYRNSVFLCNQNSICCDISISSSGSSKSALTSVTLQTSTLTISTRDCSIYSHKYTLLAQETIPSNKFYFIIKQILDNILIISWTCDFNFCNLRIDVTWQGADMELPDDNMEMSKHAGVRIM